MSPNNPPPPPAKLALASALVIMLFVCHPKILHKRCFQFLLGVK